MSNLYWLTEVQMARLALYTTPTDVGHEHDKFTSCRQSK